MNGKATLTMGDRGRLVIPAETRQRLRLTEGTPLVLLETPGALVLMTRDQLKARVRADYATAPEDLVASLLSDRRAAADAEDRA
jgi:AbrB family looped-hinge helix DNA binding protein